MTIKDEKQLTLERRMEIFLRVVEAQDQELGTVRARQLVAKKFDVSESAVRRIEDEGVEADWPPLN